MNSALLVVDAQESFRQREDWSAVSNPSIVDEILALVEPARARGDLVVWVLHAEPGSGGVFDPARGFVQLLPGLSVTEGEPVLTKTAHNAFTTTNLQQQLTQHGVKEVVVSGIRTEQCCETTARIASDLGFDVTFVSDATATMPLADPRAPAGRPYREILADPRTLSTAQVVQRTEYALAGRFARVCMVRDLVGTSA
ncbi:isochorismatase family protein [Microlunatus flavus]|nr:isochorismatase family protein [Microlunatus flavus]